MKIKKYIQMICTIMMVIICSLTNKAYATEKVVRVAFLAEMYGFYEIKENGNYAGYNYEYLMNVAQHTGWEYEFVIIDEGSVSASLIKAEKMLENGEIDLLGPYSATSSRFSDFETGERNYGVYRYNFYSSIHNYAMSEDNYFLKDKISVALVENYIDLNDKFYHLIESRGYELDVTYVQTHAETIDLLLHEKVDTIINLDMSSHSKYLDYLTTVDRIPYYFVSTKGNTELIAELDEAIRKIEILEPDIHQRLLEVYFSVSYDEDMLFTEQETLSMSQIDTFKVGFLRNVPPYQYINDNGEATGITIDLLDKLEEIIGVSFDYYWYDTLQELSGAISTAEIDMIGTLSNNYNLAHSLGVTLTRPYTSAGVYWIRSVDEEENANLTYHYVSDEIPFDYKKEELTMVWDIKETLDTIEKTGTISVICDPYITDYYLSRYQYDNIEIKAVSNVLNELTFGVGKHIDENLIGMMNRAMMYLDTSEVDEIIFKHTSVKTEYTLGDMISNNMMEINIVILCVFSIVIASIHNTLRKFRDLSRRDSLTKVYNSGYFHEYVSQNLEKIDSGALILIDIDYFKNVNDTYGHQVGDEIIKYLAKNLEKLFTTNFVIGRLGGDEFAVFSDGIIDKTILENKVKELLNLMVNNEESVSTTLSMGGVIFKNTTIYSELYKEADKVLYKVKEDGRNGFQFEVQ